MKQPCKWAYIRSAPLYPGLLHYLVLYENGMNINQFSKPVKFHIRLGVCPLHTINYTTMSPTSANS